MNVQRSESCVLSRWDLLKAKLNNLPLAEFKLKAKLVNSSIFIDVRKAEEIIDVPFKKAMHIDYLSYTLADELEKLDPEQHYFVYCSTGRRSARICVILNNLGFKYVYNLENGL